MSLAEIWVMPNSDYVSTKQEQVSEDLLCIQSKGLSVTEIYSGVEGLDITMSFYFLVMEKMAKICTRVNVEGARFLGFSTWEKAGKAGLHGHLLFSWGWEIGGSCSCLMQWRSGLILWLFPCENRISNEHLKAVNTGEDLLKHFTGAFSGPGNEIGFNKVKQKRLK